MLAESSGSVSSFKVNCLPQHLLNRICLCLYFAGLLAFINLSAVWSISHLAELEDITDSPPVTAAKDSVCVKQPRGQLT